MQQRYPLTGTFIDEITYDIPSSNWTDEQWTKDLDYMKEVGMDTVIFIRGAFYDKCIYPSNVFPTLREPGEDLAKLIMEEAAKRDMKVFMGMYISNLNWNAGDYRHEIEQNKKFVKEVLERYGDMPAFKGWYIPQEGNDTRYNLKELMGGLSALCKEASPDKSVLISPYFKGKNIEREWFTPERTAAEWNDIFNVCGKNVDYCAFQDGTIPLSEYEEHFSIMKKVCDAHHIGLWANVETFERDVRCMYYPIPFELLRKKIQLATPYVEKMITFEFSHFLSPQSIYPSAHNLNTLYKKYYGPKK